jgi:serine/threonine protein kinase
MHPMRALVSIPRNPPPCLRQAHMWSNEFNDFIRRCLVKDFEIRPSVSQILSHPFVAHISDNGIDARRRIVQIVQRYKRGYDLCGKKSRETCGVKNGRIRGKSETCSSPIVDTPARADEVLGDSLAEFYSPLGPNASVVDNPETIVSPPLKKFIQVIGNPYNPPHQTIDTPRRAAPLPPSSPLPVQPTHDTPCRQTLNEIEVDASVRPASVHKTKHKSQSRRHRKQMQMLQVRYVFNDRYGRWPVFCFSSSSYSNNFIMSINHHLIVLNRFITTDKFNKMQPRVN